MSRIVRTHGFKPRADNPKQCRLCGLRADTQTFGQLIHGSCECVECKPPRAQEGC